MTLLDLGCGHGALANALAARGCRVTGADSSAISWIGRAPMPMRRASRTVIRNGRVRQLSFVKRLFGFPELRDWLVAAGFKDVDALGEDGQSLTADHKRMIVVARWR